MVTWLSTREAPQDDGSVAVPCLETRLLPWPWPQPPGALDVTLFTSQRAVECWREAGRPALGPVAALSPATSAVLRQAGVEPEVVCEGGAVALAEALAGWWRARGCPRLTLRYPTSAAGLRSQEQRAAVRVLSPLGPLERRCAYEVSPPPGLKARLEQLARGAWAIRFYSPSAVHHFFAARAALAPPTEARCHGASTARAWNRHKPPHWPEATVSHHEVHA